MMEENSTQPLGPGDFEIVDPAFPELSRGSKYIYKDTIPSTVNLFDFNFDNIANNKLLTERDCIDAFNDYSSKTLNVNGNKYGGDRLAVPMLAYTTLVTSLSTEKYTYNLDYRIPIRYLRSYNCEFMDIVLYDSSDKQILNWTKHLLYESELDDLYDILEGKRDLYKKCTLTGGAWGNGFYVYTTVFGYFTEYIEYAIVETWYDSNGRPML